jgi:hypothetical protein
VDLIPPPSDPKFILRFTVRDNGQILLLEYEYASNMDAKNSMDVVFTGSPPGLWFNNVYYPVHMIEKAEILSPHDLQMEQKEALDKANEKKQELQKILDDLQESEGREQRHDDEENDGRKED